MNEVKLKISDPAKHIEKPNFNVKNYTAEDKKKLAKASLDFESLLTGMMLKSMNKTSGLFGDKGFGSGVLDVVFETELASFMTKSNSFGIAENLFRTMTGESLGKYKMPEIKIEVPTKKVNKPDLTKSSIDDKIARFENIIEDASKKYGIDKNIIKSIIKTESAGNEKAISKANAKGLMQLMDVTAKEMGVKNVWDPAENIYGGTKFFSQMLRLFDGDLKLALAAYNAGPGNVQKYNGIPPFEETKHYVARVMNNIKKLEEENAQ